MRNPFSRFDDDDLDDDFEPDTPATRLEIARAKLAEIRAARAEREQLRAAPREVTAEAFGVLCHADVLAEAADSGLKQFRVTYDGGAIDDPRFELPIVLDLSGLTMAPTLCANMNGDRKAIVGHIPAAGASIDGGKLTLQGVVSGVGRDALEFTASAEQGFPWKATIDAKPDRIIEIPQGRSIQANGQTFTGPILVARNAKLFGVAFSARGTDDGCIVVEAVPPDYDK